MGSLHPKRFTATQAQKLSFKFCINHYAGPVVYSTELFMEKNKDELPAEVTELFTGSSVPLLKIIFTEPPATGVNKKTGTITVCTQFRDQLTSLMEKINHTKPHYVRCLKPNDKNLPDTFDRLRITEQLKYGGVLEAVRVARAGFPMRMPLDGFYNHYKRLANPFNPITATLPHKLDKNDKAVVEQLKVVLWDDTSKPSASDPLTLKKVREMAIWKGKSSTANVNSQQVQLGKTKVFMRRPPYDLLEGRNARYNYLYASRIQRLARGMVVRAWYRSAKWAIVRLQRWARDLKLWKVIARRIDAKRAKGILPPKYVPPPMKEKKKKVQKPPSKSKETPDTTVNVPDFMYGEGRPRTYSRDKDYNVPLAKPATIVSRRLVGGDSRKEAGSIDDDVYRWLFGVNPPRGTGATGKKVITKEHEQERTAARPTIMPAPVIKAAPQATKAPPPLFAKETVRSVGTDSTYRSVGGRNRKNKQLGTFYKKNATKEESEEYKRQFPAQWSQASLVRFFSRS